MTIPIRLIPRTTQSVFTALETSPYQQSIPRSIHISTRVWDQHHDPKIHNKEDDEVRANAIRARESSYAGWWTEVMNYHQTPQTQHVFQDQSAAKPTSEKGYANTLPRATTIPPQNTLPTAPPSGSTTPVTGTISSLSAPTSESFQYHGFRIPIKPTPPGSEDCCMSGCAHCIYDIYAEDRQDYKFQLAKVLKEIEAAGLPPPPNFEADSTNAGDAASTGNSKEDDDDMDPGMKAFLELERKLRGS